MAAPKIFVLDIETAPIEAWTWGIWDQNIGIDQIKTDWSILAYCAKELGDSKIIYADTGGKGKKQVRNDKRLLQDIWNLLDSADIIVAQNGARFDLPRINSRLIANGYGPYSPVRVIDTLAVSRRTFGFTSNKLAWVAKYTTDQHKSEHKKFPGFGLWKECLNDNPEAWREMEKYNKQDVIATLELYKKQRPWISNHPNLSAYAEERQGCPKCASPRVQARGYAVTQSGKYQRFQCSDCGAWSRGKQNLLTPASRRSKLV